MNYSRCFSKNRVRSGVGLLASAFLLTSCIELGDAPGDIIAPAELSSGVKNLIVYRRPAFFLDNKPVFLTLNGIDIAKIKINEFVEVGVTEGPHTLGARCSTSERPLTREWRLVEHHFTVHAIEDPLFIELGPCQFEERTEVEAERLLDDYTSRPLKDGVSTRLKDWVDEQKRKLEERRHN